jgi:hypothetical protein
MGDGQLADGNDDRILQSLLDWARKEGLVLSPARTAALKLALSRPVSGGSEQDHRGVTLPPRHRAGGIITPQ